MDRVENTKKSNKQKEKNWRQKLNLFDKEKKYANMKIILKKILKKIYALLNKKLNSSKIEKINLIKGYYTTETLLKKIKFNLNIKKLYFSRKIHRKIK